MTQTMNQEEVTQARREALRRAAEFERRWQDARAERQRASELFAGSSSRSTVRRRRDEADEA